MKNTIISLFVVLKSIEENFKNLYDNISFLYEKSNFSLSTTALVLAREEKKHENFYEILINKYNSGDKLFIVDEIYNKAKNVLISFKAEIKISDFRTQNDLIKFALSYEERNINILKELTNFLSESTANNAVEIQRIFIGIINQEEKHLTNLKIFLKE